MRPLAALVLVALLAACATAPGPVHPDRPDCVKPDEKEPTDGGLGGTGNAPEIPCPPPAD